MFNINKNLIIGLLVGALSIIPFTAYDGAREAPTQIKERSSGSEIANRGYRGRRSYRNRGYRRGYRNTGYRNNSYRYYRSPYYYNTYPGYYYYYDRPYYRGYNRPRSGLNIRFGW